MRHTSISKSIFNWCLLWRKKLYKNKNNSFSTISKMSSCSYPCFLERGFIIYVTDVCSDTFVSLTSNVTYNLIMLNRPQFLGERAHNLAGSPFCSTLQHSGTMTCNLALVQPPTASELGSSRRIVLMHFPRLILSKDSEIRT